MTKSDCFEKEINWIKDRKIRMFTAYCISQLPDYFFRVPASSSGKYHPSYALGDGGLVRHTKAAVMIAHELFNLEMFQKQFSEEQQDLILASLFLHDGLKQGNNVGHTIFEHPLSSANFIIKCNSERLYLTRKQVRIIYDAIQSHMGQWNTSLQSKTILPKPKNDIQKFVHMCDYLASRKFLEVNFENIN